jgi:4-oxalocrotonate tautomerase
MPLAQICMTPGRTEEQKRQLIEKITQACVDALGVAPESVWVTIQEVPRTDWGVAGKPLSSR